MGMCCRRLLEAKDGVSVELLREGLPTTLVHSMSVASSLQNYEEVQALLHMQLAMLGIASTTSKHPTSALAQDMTSTEALEICSCFIESIPCVLNAAGGLKEWHKGNNGVEGSEELEDCASKCLIYLLDLYPFHTIRQVPSQHGQLLIVFHIVKRFLFIRSLVAIVAHGATHLQGLASYPFSLMTSSHLPFVRPCCAFSMHH